MKPWNQESAISPQKVSLAPSLATTAIMPVIKDTSFKATLGSKGDGFCFRRFPELDGLRGIAILLVIGGHVLDKQYRISTGLGELGVLIFFVLSGFLISGLLERERLQTGSISLTAFYTRRVLRIGPAFSVYIAVLSVLIITGTIRDTPWYSVAAAVFLVHNVWGRGAAVGHLWTLSLEEQFYAIWPWIMKRFGSLGALRIAVAGIGGVSAFRMVCMQLHWLEHGFARTFYYRPWFRFDAILIGCAAVLWLGRTSNASSWGTYLGSPVVPTLCWPALVWWTMRAEQLHSVWYITLQTLLAAIVFLNVIVSDSSVVKLVFRFSILRWFGRLSYSWYLWQQLFIYSDLSGSKLEIFPLNIVISLVIAYLSYTVIEKPFLRLKDRLITTTIPGRFQNDDYSEVRRSIAQV